MPNSLGTCTSGDGETRGKRFTEDDTWNTSKQVKKGISEPGEYQIGMSGKITITHGNIKYRLEGPRGAKVTSMELNTAASEAYYKRLELQCFQVSRSPVLKEKGYGYFFEIYMSGMLEEVGDFPLRKGFAPRDSFIYDEEAYSRTILSDRGRCLCDHGQQISSARRVAIKKITFRYNQFQVNRVASKKNTFGYRDMCFNLGTISPERVVYDFSLEDVQDVVYEVLRARMLASCFGASQCWVFPEHSKLNIHHGIYLEVYKNIGTPNIDGLYPSNGCEEQVSRSRSSQAPHEHGSEDGKAHQASQPPNPQHWGEHHNGEYPTYYEQYVHNPTGFTGTAFTIPNPHTSKPVFEIPPHNPHKPLPINENHHRHHHRHRYGSVPDRQFSSQQPTTEYIQRNAQHAPEGVRRARSRSRPNPRDDTHDHEEDLHPVPRRSSSRLRGSVNYISPNGDYLRRRSRSRSRPGHRDEIYDNDYVAQRHASYLPRNPIRVYVNAREPPPMERPTARHHPSRYH